MIRRPPRSTQSRSSAASDVYKRQDLVEFMISGPVMIQVLEGENAILKNRDLMGATDPKKAAAGTIRADFADSIDANAVHGSDAAETAATEISFFFPGMNVYSR